MKRHDNLFSQVANFENIYAAYEESRKGKDFKPEVIAFSVEAESRIGAMLEKLLDGSWQASEYHEFELRTEVKRRQVNAPTFGDCVLQRALLNVINPFFERKFIFDSYANRTGKGNHKAVFRLQKFLKKCVGRGGRAYVGQGDVHHYYASIPHAVLQRDISRTIADERVLSLARRIIEGYSESEGTGLPIGAPFSQLAANIYLDPLDHFVKEKLRAKYYLRLMDDFVLVDTDKERLKRNMDEIRRFVTENRKLTLNRKTQIYPASHGVDFGGYRTFVGRILPRKRNIKAAKIRFKTLSFLYRHKAVSMKEIRPRAASFRGYIMHCRARRTAASVFKHLELKRQAAKGVSRQSKRNETLKGAKKMQGAATSAAARKASGTP